MKILFLLLLLSPHLYASFCEADKKKFCHQLTGARGETAKCLSEHFSQITPACAKELQDFKKKAAKENPCFQDLAEYCPEIPNRERNLYYCLLKSESRLGQTCLADFKKKKPFFLSKEPCADDVLNLCYPEVRGTQGAINRCLIRERKKLSKACSIVTEKKITEYRKKNSCFDDTEKFCPTQVKVSDIQDCLEKKLNQLQPACKNTVTREMSLAAANPCYKDLMRLCKPRLAPKEQDLCLSLSEKELSQACKQYRVDENIKIQKIKTSCEADRLKHCIDVPLQGGLVLKCLRQKRAQLMPGCQSLL